MNEENQAISFKERVQLVRRRIVEKLYGFQPGPKTYVTAFCVGATIAEYAALAGSSDPIAILAAVSALSSALGVNLLADLIGNREPPASLTIDQITELVQYRLDEGESLPAVRTLLQEFGTLQIALNTWHREEDDRFQLLINELSEHPQIIASQVVNEIMILLEPYLTAFDRRTLCIQEILEKIADSQKEIRCQLGLDRPKSFIVEEISSSISSLKRSGIFNSGGLCSGYMLKPMPDRFFVAQEFSSVRDDLRNALSDALSEFDVHPIAADDSYWSGPRLCKISAIIQGTPFGIYQLDISQNRNVHLELGIALGLGRPFVLIKDKKAELAGLLEGLEFYELNSYLETRYELGKLLNEFIANISNYKPKSLPEAGSRKTALIAHSNLEPIDFSIAVSRLVYKYGLIPVILGDQMEKISGYLNREKIPHQILSSGSNLTSLEQTMAVIQESRVGVYRIDEDGDPNTFLALGISMSLNRIGLLLKKNSSKTPSDLRGLNLLEYSSYSQLEELFQQRFGQFFFTR